MRCASRGALVALFPRLHQATRAEQEALLAQAQANPVVPMDETGWRANGQNGYVWGLLTPGPAPVCYDASDRSRAGSVAAGLLADFHGRLVTDYYAAYNHLRCKHQRCWVHLRRDLHALKEAHAVAAEVVQWTQALRALYDQAQAARADPTGLTPCQRVHLAPRLEAQAARLAVRFAGQKRHPFQALATRLLRHQGDLFAFVRVDGLDADNNRAERLLRPIVVQRKISGGTRSTAGTATRLGFASLVPTWHARGLTPFQECLALLHSHWPPIWTYWPAQRLASPRRDRGRTHRRGMRPAPPPHA